MYVRIPVFRLFWCTKEVGHLGVFAMDYDSTYIGIPIGFSGRLGMTNKQQALVRRRKAMSPHAFMRPTVYIRPQEIPFVE